LAFSWSIVFWAGVPGTDIVVVNEPPEMPARATLVAKIISQALRTSHARRAENAPKLNKNLAIM
jgi:hypothetical protein